ncbi:hypothetical protein [Roseitranquillus sediminis]|uniref:hypothetical protein n=1 Tax=Roseitranquillus sediminis TaxID=2809051 RepID=UPI001D0C03DC|nr:hypothetical protein [Roseitranquillus sediminis]MBM9595309.1 hypothetical protein [Roseitranquillus sediminis]
MSALFGILTSLPLPLLAVVFLGVWAYVEHVCDRSVDSEGSRAWIYRQLQRLQGASIYARTMQAALSRLSNAARPQVAARDGTRRELWRRLTFTAASERDAEATARNPWGWPVLDFALRLALVYPIACAFLQWIWFGDAIYFGDIVLFGPAAWWERAAVAAALVIATLMLSERLWRAALRRVRRDDWLWLGPPLGFVLFMSPAIIFINTFAGAGAFAMGWGVIFAFIAAQHGFGLLGTTIAIVVAGSVASQSAFFALGLLALLVVFSPHCAEPLVLRRRGVLAYLLMIGILAGAMLLALVPMRPTGVVPDYAQVVLLFLGVFPLINALFDYVSYGWTLTLLSRGRTRGWRAALYGLADVVSALVILAALGCALTATVAFLNRWVGPSFYPLEPVFDGAAAMDADYYWLYAMAFSTLLPTYVHIVLASFSLVGFVGREPREWIWRHYASGEDWIGGRLLGSLLIGLVAALAVTIPLAVAWMVVGLALDWSDEIGRGYIGLFRSLARSLGEPV